MGVARGATLWRTWADAEQDSPPSVLSEWGQAPCAPVVTPCSILRVPGPPALVPEL